MNPVRYDIHSGIHHPFMQRISAAILALVITIGVPIAFALWQGGHESAQTPNTSGGESQQPITAQEQEAQESQNQKTDQADSNPVTAQDSEATETPQSVESSDSGQSSQAINTDQDESVSQQQAPSRSERPAGGRGGGPPPETHMNNDSEFTDGK